MRQVRRDPFARTTLMRSSVNSMLDTCDWCGGSRYFKGKMLNRLFVYMTVHDGGRKYIHGGKFCSASCHDSYHR